MMNRAYSNITKEEHFSYTYGHADDGKSAKCHHESPGGTSVDEGSECQDDEKVHHDAIDDHQSVFS